MLRAGAKPTNGSANDIVWKTVKFKRSSAPVVGTITSLMVKFGDKEAAEGEMVVLPNEAVTVTWVAEGDVESYSYEIRDDSNVAIASNSGVDVTSYEIAANAITAGGVYTLTINAIPTNGTESDATKKTVQFKRNTVTGDFIMSNGVITGYIGNGGAIEIPSVDYDGNTITAIGEAAFKDNATITSVTVSAKVTVIGESAFENCMLLESVALPNGVTTIGKAAFKNCGNLATMSAFD